MEGRGPLPGVPSRYFKPELSDTVWIPTHEASKGTMGMAWEEKTLMMEKEEEARRREENRQHETNLFSMLACMLSHNP